MSASNVKDWSGNPDNNDSAPPLGAPENATFIADCNNIDRQIMADSRLQFEDQGWFNWGHTVANTNATTFTVSNIDATAIYTVKRKLRIEDATVLYDEVASVSYVAPNTVVTVATGGLSAAMNGQTVSTGLPIEAGVGYTEDEVDALLTGKMDLVSPATDDNAMVMDANGQAVDAGVPLASVDVTVVPVTVPGANNSTTTPHGVSAFNFYMVELVSKVTSGGVTTGDRIPIGAFSWATDSKSASNVGFSVQVNDTNVILRNVSDSGGTPAIQTSASTRLDITATNFDAQATFVNFAQITIP